MDKQWQKIVQISSNMLVAAKNANWGSLIELESTREGLIKLFFEKEIKLTNKDAIKQGILGILNMDREISALAKIQSAQIKDELSKLKNNRSAISQYNQFSR